MAAPTPKLPPQVVRLVLLTIAIVGSYLIARYFLTPPSFGDYGFFRGRALEEIASHPLTYAGKDSCEDCHYDQYKELRSAEHQNLSCEGCHGAGHAHTQNPDISMAILNVSHCARCHEYNPSRPAWHHQIDLREHYAGNACTDCHKPHAPTEVPELKEGP